MLGRAFFGKNAVDHFAPAFRLKKIGQLKQRLDQSIVTIPFGSGNTALLRGFKGKLLVRVFRTLQILQLYGFYQLTDRRDLGKGRIIVYVNPDQMLAEQLKHTVTAFTDL